MDIITSFPTYFMAFMNHLDLYHWIQFGILAVFFGIAATSAASVIILPVFGALVYIGADVIIPPLVHHTTINVPAFTKGLVEEGIALYVAFLVAIIVVYAVKKAVMAMKG